MQDHMLIDTEVQGARVRESQVVAGHFTWGENYAFLVDGIGSDVFVSNINIRITYQGSTSNVSNAPSISHVSSVLANIDLLDFIFVPQHSPLARL